MTDARALAALVTPSISQWLASWPFPCTAQQAQERVTSARSAGLARAAMVCVIEHSEEIVGWIEAHRAHPDKRTAQLSYWIGEAYQGRGYAREAALRLAPEAFRFLDVSTIEAGAQPGNAGSFAVMRALGMRYAGERSVFAAARSRQEVCRFYVLDRVGGGDREV